MLKVLRHKNVSKVIFWFLVILILPAFVLWGTGSLGRGSGPSYVGKIDNRKVSFEEFHNAIVGVRTQIILNYFDDPKALESLLKNRSMMGRLAWYRLIRVQEAKKRNIRVPDADVITYITKTNPIFLRGGSFDEQVYEYVLRNNMGLEPRTFEEIVRQNLAVQRLEDSLTGAIAVTDEETAEIYRRDNQRFKVAYLTYPAGNFTAGIQIPEAEARAYYDAHRNELMVPVKDASGAETMRAAGFDDAKEDITAYLTEVKGRQRAMERAEADRRSIDSAVAGGATFREAAAKLGLQEPAETVFFGKTDYIEGLGEAARLAAAAAKLQKGMAGGPVEMRKGAVIFSLVDTQDFDAEKFKAAKDDYAKKALQEKKTKFLEDWLRGLERETSVVINLDEYQKYYR